MKSAPMLWAKAYRDSLITAAQYDTDANDGLQELAAYWTKHSLKLKNRLGDSFKNIEQAKDTRKAQLNTLSKSADKIFLFTTQGSVSPVDGNVTVIQPEDLFVFVTRNANLIPDSVKMWLHFKQESVI
jgi:hypothetical protein